MNYLLSKLTPLSIILGAFLLFTPAVLAAAPDGSGPWADSVVSTAQGLRKNGSAVVPTRSDATQALGVAEDTNAEGTFYSLGFGGSITLQFDNSVSGGVIVVEATNPGYPTETAQVSVSVDGSTWVTAGSVSTDGQVSMPESVPCARYVRITDTSNPNDFGDDTADAYDVDGVRTAEGTPCTPPGGGGSTTVVVHNSSTCTVTQSTATSALTSVVNTAKTGGNKIKNATGGSNAITSGLAKAKTKVKVKGGDNIATGCGCCDTGCSNGNVNVVISGN